GEVSGDTREAVVHIPIDSNEVVIANPFGGLIYIVVPDGAAEGMVTVRLHHAVRSPLYSTTNPLRSSVSAFFDDVNDGHVPWMDAESSKFMYTLPTAMIRTEHNPAEILDVWDEIMDALAILGGRSTDRYRAEWVAPDRMVPFPGTAATASYPMSPGMPAGPTFSDARNNTWWSPLRVLQTGEDAYYKTTPSSFIVLHEFGHLHNYPTLPGEIESNVNLPAVIAYQTVFDASFDEAFKYSIDQRLTLDGAALDWMVSPNFPSGEIGVDPDYGQERQYQSRGHAKWVEIAQLFSWESLGAINGVYVQRGIDQGRSYDYYITPDDMVTTASTVLGVNVAPLFEFWGITLSASVRTELMNLPASNLIRQRLEHYRDLVPNNNSAFRDLYDAELADNFDDPNDHHHQRYQEVLQSYNRSQAEAIRDRIDTILEDHF
ncbi:MAG: M60 family metallopeptidase, partial [Myxococcota bacterium]